MNRSELISKNSLYNQNKQENLTVSLCEIDAYTRSSFEELQKERFEAKMDYYICIVEEEGRIYQYDAYQFILSFIRNQNMNNPLTNLPIGNFSIYVSSKEDPRFRFHESKENILNNLNFYPLLWNEPRCSKEDQIACLLQYGEKVEEINEQKAMQAYEKAHRLGSIDAKLKISEYYKKKSDIDSSLFWAEKVVKEDNPPSIQNMLFCAAEFRSYHREDKAYEYFILAAKENNCWGLLEVINRLEEGIGVEVNPTEAQKWRKELPEKWQNSSMESFFNYLQSIHYGFQDVGLPPEKK